MVRPGKTLCQESGQSAMAGPSAGRPASPADSGPFDRRSVPSGSGDAERALSRWCQEVTMPNACLRREKTTEPPTAVVWISGRHAVVVVGDIKPGGIASWSTERMLESEADFL